jgi:hypothetical protein
MFIVPSNRKREGGGNPALFKEDSPVREKPFTATLTDPTRSFIQGHAGHEFYRLERDTPQPVSEAVASALRETLYQVTIEGNEPAIAKIAETKTKGAPDEKPAAGKAGKSGKAKTTGIQKDAEEGNQTAAGNNEDGKEGDTGP